MTVRITEASKAAAPTGARTLITLITPGWGSSGYYSAEALEQAATDLVFPANTQMHIDHDTDGGVGSVSTLAAVLAEDARWEPDWVDPDTGVKGRLAAENKVFSHKQQLLKELKDVIGTSIAAAAEVSLGEAEGRQGRIIERLLPSPTNRVDYVTVAGRGGRISEVLESYAGHVTEITADDTRTVLQAAVRAVHPSSGMYAWVVDHDDTNVWYVTEDREAGTKTWQQGYTIDGATATLTGDPIEVRRITTYVPVAAATESKDSPPDPAGVTEGKEPTVATIQIEEAEHRNLVAESSRAADLAVQLEEANAKLAAAEQATVTSKAEAIVAEAFGDLEAKVTRRSLVAAALAAEAFNPEALKADAEEAAAELRVATGAGTVRGVGSTQESTTPALTPEAAREQILAASGYTPKGA